MYRFAVLHDLSDDSTPPIGLALERDDHVFVFTPGEFGIAQRQDGEYRVLGPDLTYISYVPGDPGYFEQVLGSISWAFGVGEIGKVPVADDEMFLKLVCIKVDRPRGEARQGTYGEPAVTIVRDHDVSVVWGVETTYHASDEELGIAARGDGVVAV
jgi:hypothetical protein